MKNVFVTGATGYLGYHIVKVALSEGHNVMCLRRNTSISLFEDFVEDSITWLNIDDSLWKIKLADFKPDVLIHCAWGGVRGNGRDDEEMQEQNILFSQEIYESYPYKQIISLGSQAEYGYYAGRVNETYECNPTTAYGRAKLKCSKLLKAYCERKSIEWQWVRIFTVFGEKQTGGLIRMFTEKCLNGEKTFDTTKGTQMYSYMYTFDFAKAICEMIGKDGKSGIYNLSQPSSVKSNRDVIELIKELTHSNIEVNYGAIPYPEGQIMYMDGNVEKYIRTFGLIRSTGFEKALERTIESIKNESI